MNESKAALVVGLTQNQNRTSVRLTRNGGTVPIPAGSQGHPLATPVNRNKQNSTTEVVFPSLPNLSSLSPSSPHTWFSLLGCAAAHQSPIRIKACAHSWGQVFCYRIKSKNSGNSLLLLPPIQTFPQPGKLLASNGQKQRCARTHHPERIIFPKTHLSNYHM